MKYLAPFLFLIPKFGTWATHFFGCVGLGGAYFIFLTYFDNCVFPYVFLGSGFFFSFFSKILFPAHHKIPAVSLPQSHGAYVDVVGAGVVVRTGLRKAPAFCPFRKFAYGAFASGAFPRAAVPHCRPCPGRASVGRANVGRAFCIRPAGGAAAAAELVRHGSAVAKWPPCVEYRPFYKV